MSEYAVVVADSSRARFFTLEAAKVPEVESGPNLQERSDLVNPEIAVAGRDTAPGGGPAHGYDVDHRDRRVDEIDRRFARRIVDTAIDLVRQQGVKCLVLAASSRMLGFLREAIGAPAGGNKLEIREVAKDLTHHAPLDIHRHLAEANLIPARESRSPAQWQRSAGPGSGSNWSG